MTDFLLELRSEEIPARMQAKARSDLEALFTAQLTAAGLQAQSITVYSTPRRLALIAQGLPLKTLAVSEETKGPKTSAPPQALEGFLRKTGLTQDQLTQRDGIYFAIIEKPGRATADVLAEAIPTIIRAFPWPKSMRWGDASLSTESLKWVRPLSGIIALFGDDVVPCEVDGLVSGCVTAGHRFHHHGDITIGNAADYAMKLRAAHVILDHNERQDIVRAGAAKAAADAGLVLVEDEGLVIENAGLTEWPVPLLGWFDAAFLEVPGEVIQLTARVNQKYFICRDGAGTLANAFVCTANISAHDGGAAIVAGNEKVLAARLSDAKFFWEADLKVPLATQAEKLSSIVFHEKLGTVADKVERVAKLARWLVEEGIVGTQELADAAERAALLCKADLVTGMVGEFPELQGIMGGYYARAQGESDAVADAIRDHYKPAGQGDDVPAAPVTVAVSLADKLDTLVGFFANDMPPTGSKDPFALRRAAIAIAQLILFNKLRLSLIELLGEAFHRVMKDSASAVHEKQMDYVWESINAVAETPEAADEQFHAIMTNDDMLQSYSQMTGLNFETPKLVTDFLIDRLKVQQREAGVRHDLIDAVFALGGEDDLVRLLARVKALQAFVTTDEGANLLAGYKRAANILKNSGGSKIIPVTPAKGVERHVTLNTAHHQVSIKLQSQAMDSRLRENDELGDIGVDLDGEELALESALNTAEPLAAAAIEAEDFAAAMTALATLREPIDAFFEGVMVNDPDPDKRAFRIGLLTRFRDAVHTVADFSKIEG